MSTTSTLDLHRGTLTGQCHTCGSKDLADARFHISDAGWDADYLVVCAACHQKAADALAINGLIARLKRNPELAKVLREVLEVVS